MKNFKKLSVNPKWDEIEKVRNMATSFLKSHRLSKDTVYSVTMIISELSENAIKYGNFKQPEDRVDVSIHITDDNIMAEVINPVAMSEYQHLKRLDQTIQWIRGFQDPFEAYLERLKEVSRKPFTDEESGLGLVRIAYEGRAILDFYVGEDDILNVSAISNK
ncbi:MAG: ATP-binding protein [Desulfobacterales bacterium]|nr:ATP-binding protein [Desulfobacterales bacterium]